MNNIIGRYNELFDELSAYDCKIYMQSILPVSASQNGSEMINPDVEEINNRLMGICESRGITYINLWEQFKDDDGALRDEFYYDGVHINSTAYKRWKELIDQYVYE